MIAALLADITALFAVAFVVACCQISCIESKREEARLAAYHDTNTASDQKEQPADMPERQR